MSQQHSSIARERRWRRRRASGFYPAIFPSYARRGSPDIPDFSGSSFLVPFIILPIEPEVENFMKWELHPLLNVNVMQWFLGLHRIDPWSM